VLLRPSYGIKSISSEGSNFGIVIRHDRDLKLLQRYTFQANPLDGLHRVIVTAPVITTGTKQFKEEQVIVAGKEKRDPHVSR
jgi:hypothetical protein